MTIFDSSDQFYQCAEALFDRVQVEHPDAARAVANAKLLIRLRCSDPLAEIVINGPKKPVSIDYGPVRLRPELDVELTTDTLHQILLGELSLPKALSSKAMKVKGPVWKTLSLAELFELSQNLYPQILAEQGIGG